MFAGKNFFNCGPLFQVHGVQWLFGRKDNITALCCVSAQMFCMIRMYLDNRTGLFHVLFTESDDIAAISSE